jgi:predicted nucleotidyltransferase
MRITEFERECLINSIKKIDSDAKIWLFGSRVFDNKKGGDIDIAVLSPKIDLLKRIAIKQTIEDTIGEQKIDLLVSKDGSAPFLKWHVIQEFYYVVKNGMDILKNNVQALKSTHPAAERVCTRLRIKHKLA